MNNEDAHVLESFEFENSSYQLACVFDGHAGDAAARYAAEHFKERLLQQETFPSRITHALKNTFI